ncbi:MAG: DUF1800 domain-containing protein [Phycisphaerales bacterium]|nr:DUF1800 domain-containing protein [Phycisphaerales bacterium]
MPRPLEPLDPKDFGYWEAHHLLQRAGFGGSPEQVLTLTEMGLDGAVDHLLRWRSVPDPVADPGFKTDIMRPPTDEERQAYRMARRADNEAALEQARMRRQAAQREDRQQMATARDWWLTRMIETSRPLQEKMTLFWHGHFATGYRPVEDSWHMLKQNELFRNNATGDFKNVLVKGIIRDPAMIKYLNNNQNRRQAPNENLARELMELFTLGEGNGYTEDDIKEGARALTGFTFRDDDFVFNSRNHDSGTKSIFGHRGNHGADDFVELIFTRPTSSTWICWKLYRFFVDDAAASTEQSMAVVNEMGRQMQRARYTVDPVLEALFKSKHFYHPTRRGTMVKSPIQLVVQACRTMDLPARNVRRLNDACATMGQSLFSPPSVKGWDAGTAWINTSTLFTRQNTLVYLLTGREPGSNPWDGGGTLDHDMSRLVSHLPDIPRRDRPKDAATYLARFLLGTMPDDYRLNTWADLARGRDLDAATVTRLVAIITAAPEYQLC